MIRIAAVLMIGMKIWMLVDAYRRQADTYWLWIIVGVPGGSLIYFFMVRMRDPDIQRIQGRVLSSLKRPPSVDTLERRYQDSASVMNRLALAQGLGDAGRWSEAKSHFEGVLEQRPDDSDALYGLGVSEIELGKPERAVDPLKKLIQVAPIYRDYIAYADLADALYQSGKADECVELLRNHVKSNARLPHVVLLARYLAKTGHRDEAKRELKKALDRHQDAPRHVKRDNRSSFREAKKILAEVS